MNTRRVILLGVVAVLAVLPFLVRHYRGNPLPFESELSKYTPIEEVLERHDERIKNRINLLKKQSLDESFVELLESQQYIYPGFHPAGIDGPKDIQEILSTRTFLKVFQQFDALPREQAVKKLNEFCKRAVKDYCDAFDALAAGNYKIGIHSAHFMLCSAMLLAARVGEHDLLLNMMNEMQSSFDGYVEKLKVAHPDLKVKPQSRTFGPMEDDCFLTVLMYALKRANIDVPFDENSLVKKTIPLCRWDAPLTHYDFAVRHGDAKINPKDVFELFVVYEFPEELWFGDPDGQKMTFINTLKERISK